MSFELRTLSLIKYYEVNQTNASQDAGLARFRESKLLQSSHNCIVCSEDNFLGLFNNDRYGIENETGICLSCGFVYTNPRFTETAQSLFYQDGHYTEIYDGGEGSVPYDESLPPIETSLHVAKQQKYTPSFFISFLKDTGILEQVSEAGEIGVGFGNNLLYLNEFGILGKGYEPSPARAKYAESKGIQIIAPFFEDAPQAFDLLVVKHVLEHVYNPILFLREIHQNKTKNLFIEVPGIVTQMPSLQNAHNFYFSLNTLRAVCAAAGYRCKSIDFHPRNDFIVGLFTREEKVAPFDYNLLEEIRSVKLALRKYKIMQVKKTIRRLLPGL